MGVCVVLVTTLHKVDWDLAGMGRWEVVGRVD